MTIYEINAATIYRVAHDAKMDEQSRLRLIAQLLRAMCADQPVTTEAADE